MIEGVKTHRVGMQGELVGGSQVDIFKGVNFAARRPSRCLTPPSRPNTKTKASRYSDYHLKLVRANLHPKGACFISAVHTLPAP